MFAIFGEPIPRYFRGDAVAFVSHLEYNMRSCFYCDKSKINFPSHLNCDGNIVSAMCQCTDLPTQGIVVHILVAGHEGCHC